MRTIRELINLQGRVALVTGGAGHLGVTMGETLAELGAAIAVLDKTPTVEQVAAHIHRTYQVKAVPLVIDLADETAIQSVPSMIIDHLGRLDILVNNAAFVGTSQLEGWTVPFLEQLPATWRSALDVNLTAPFILTQSCVPLLRDSGHGSIINVGSIYGMVGPNLSLYRDTDMGNPAAYAASKGGLLQLTRWLATVLAPHIRVNALTPGGIARNQPPAFVERYETLTPLARMATEEDFKGTIAFLASDLSAYVTGQNLVVDGGWTAW